MATVDVAEFKLVISTAAAPPAVTVDVAEFKLITDAGTPVATSVDVAEFQLVIGDPLPPSKSVTVDVSEFQLVIGATGSGPPPKTGVWQVTADGTLIPVNYWVTVT